MAKGIHSLEASKVIDAHSSLLKRAMTLRLGVGIASLTAEIRSTETCGASRSTALLPTLLYYSTSETIRLCSLSSPSTVPIYGSVIPGLLSPVRVDTDLRN